MHRVMKAREPSSRMVTSGFGFAGPVYSDPVFFRSMVQTPSLPSLFLMRSSKIALTY